MQTSPAGRCSTGIGESRHGDGRPRRRRRYIIGQPLLQSSNGGASRTDSAACRARSFIVSWKSP